MRKGKLFGLVSLVLLAPLEAAELRVVARDINGVPLPDAVVTLASASGHVKPASEIVIDQHGKQFRPWVTAVRKGDEITFSNHDNITHHVYSFSPAKRFSFRLQSGEQQDPVVFNEPGVVVLGCNIHDWMVGYVHVSDADYSIVTDTKGSARFPDIPVGKWRVSLWHPGLVDGALPELEPIELNGSSQTLEIRLRRHLTETGPREPLDDSSYALP